MLTQTKKSPDHTHKLNRRAIYLRAPLALIILLAIFLAPQRSASTQALTQDRAGQEPMQIEMFNGHEVLAGEVIARFVDADQDRLHIIRFVHVQSLLNILGDSRPARISLSPELAFSLPLSDLA